MAMKTIFVTCFHPFIFRNILCTETFDILRKTPDTKIVLAVQNRKKEYFEGIFGPRQITVEGFVDPSLYSAVSRAFIWVSRNIHDVGVVRFIHQRKLFRDRRFLYYYFVLFPMRMIGYSRVLVSLFRFLDAKFTSTGGAPDLFKKHKPDLIFATDIYNENDVIFLQEARRRAIPSVGMVRSWDKLSWFLLRTVPDRLIVWSDLRKKEAVKYNYIPEEKVAVTGAPHYSKYLRESRSDRAGFLKSLGLDPKRKVIFFALTGDQWVERNNSNRYVLEILSGLKDKINVIVRFPVVDQVSFLDDFFPPAHMFMNRPGLTINNAKLAYTEISEEDDKFLSNAIYHSDIVICGPSSIAIDGAFFNKPVILVNFYPEARGRWDDNVMYHSVHMAYILKSGGARMATSKEMFLEHLGRYLENPRLDGGERKKMVVEQLGAQDGKAEDRLARAVLDLL